MRERYIEHEFFEIWYENGIIFTVFKKNTILNLEVSQKAVAARMQASQNMPTPIFVDLRNVYYTDTRARKYMASKQAVEFITAGAFLIDNEIMRLAGNIFIQIDKPFVPAKLFTDRDKALSWLESYKQKN